MFEQKTSCSPKFIRVGISTFLTAVLLIAGIAYTHRHDADIKHDQNLIDAVDDGPYTAAKRSMPNSFDHDSLEIRSVPVPVTDPLIVQAGEAIRTAFNFERNKSCASRSPYEILGEIQYARKEGASNGAVTYSLEVDFNNEVVFARVVMLPGKTGAQFQFISSIPSPCEDGAEDQLAVSSLAVKRINRQNLSWTASLKTRFEGVQIKQFGLGFNSRSDDDNQAYILELMGSRSAAQLGGLDVSSSQLRATSAQLSTHERPVPIPTPAPLQNSLPTEAAADPMDNGTATISPQPSSSRRRATRSLTRTMPTNVAPPAAFDARDIYAGQAPCKAFQVLSQGACGACYAFSSAAAFGARLCRSNPASSVRNVVISPQNLLDCNQGGCAGGDVLSTMASLVTKPAVELWCDPYTGAQQTCGSTCGASNTYAAEPGSVRQVGGAGAYGVQQMQLELLRGGPGVVGFTIMSDLFGYLSGVYSPSATATIVGRHAVSLVGWGEDNGVPYWICQNSWGADWGEGGFFRIVRGADKCGIESSTGLVVVKPLIEPLCPAADCSSVATTLRDCTCRCPEGRSGPTCQDCTLRCRNGGASVDSCTRCECPMGAWGGDQQCNTGFRLSPLASCSMDPPSRITVQYSFTSASPPPTQTSFVGIYSLDETNPFRFAKSAAVCGATYPNYDSTKNGGLCPFLGSFQLSQPTVPGQYKIVVAPFSPRDANGLQGFYQLQDANIIGLYTVLPAGCSDASRAAARLANLPATLLAQRLTAAAADQSAQLAAMKARLDAALPLRASLVAEAQAALTIHGLSAAAPFVWMGVPGTICFSIPPSANVNSKSLVLYTGTGGGGNYYPAALGAGNAPLPAQEQGCTAFTVSPGVAPGSYTIALEDSTSGAAFATVSFTTDKASIAYTAFGRKGGGVSLTVSWSIPAALASALDTVRVYNSAGVVVSWFYTSCGGCQTAPGGAPVPFGSTSFIVVKDSTVQAGCVAKFHPGGGPTAVAVASDWIPWAKLGW